MRRGDRAAEGARLESVCWGNSTEGSNPSLSANNFDLPDCRILGMVEIVVETEGGIRTLLPECLREGAKWHRSLRVAKRHESLPLRHCPSGPNTERCQSGRMGRSRKPLTVHAVRGFESHPLRH